jgi:hypothetical protein
MKMTKEEYLSQIRTNTVYPTYRGIIGVIVFLGYLIVTIDAFIFLIGGFGVIGKDPLAGIGFMLLGVVATILGIVMIRFMKEVALMIADMVDSITEANARTLDANSGE